MISSQEALEIILSHQITPGARKIPLNEAIGEVLAEDVFADRPFPPFHRVTMDGIAIQTSAWNRGQKTYSVQGIQAAGDPPMTLESDAHAIEIMTGAVLPEGADAVIKVEECEFADGQVTIDTDDVQPFKNVHQEGSDRVTGDLLLSSGSLIGSAEIGVLATVGSAEISVVDRLPIAIISTGDELVDVEQSPLPHQIRRSNVISIAAELRKLGYVSTDFHLKDQKEELTRRISEILETFPVLILSGGVSKGKFDYLPEVLSSLRVQKAFHRIAQRPGKPFWFGSSGRNVVFALPGNPVSAYMCFVKYVRPWLAMTAGLAMPSAHAELKEDFSFAPDLTYFLQVKISQQGATIYAIPIPGHGSGDHANLADTDAFLELPRGREHFRTGEVFPLHLFRSIF